MSTSKASNLVKPITMNRYNDLYGSDPVAPMYVANRTEPRGNVAFSAQNDLGQPVAVLVPATFIPVDLTTQATKESLLKSTYFRRALTQGQVVIIETESAEHYLRTSAIAKSEMRKLNKMDKLIASEISALGISGDDDLEAIDLTAGSSAKRSVLFEGADSLSENQFVNAFITRAAEDSGESDDNLEREFLNKGLGLPVAELELLRKHVSRPAIVELIVQALDDAR